MAGVEILRDEYRDRYVDLSDLPDFDVTELVKIAHEYYETDILPHTDLTLRDIENMTPELKERMKSDPKLPQAEFWLRIKVCTNQTDAENLYHIARSADDAFKIMCNDKNRRISAKEAVFYASNAIAFYCVCLQKDIGNIDRKFVYYRMAEIYIYMCDYIEFVNQDDDHNLHSLLMADVLLAKVEAEYEFGNMAENVEMDIHQKLPLFSFYRMRVLKELIFKYKFHDDKLVRECADSALQFWNSPYSEGYERCRQGCWDTLLNLNKEFPELGLPKVE